MPGARLYSQFPSQCNHFNIPQLLWPGILNMSNNSSGMNIDWANQTPVASSRHLSEKFCQGPATLTSGFYPRIAFNSCLYSAFQRDKISNSTINFFQALALRLKGAFKFLK
jgi:hypothetical protein